MLTLLAENAAGTAIATVTVTWTRSVTANPPRTIWYVGVRCPSGLAPHLFTAGGGPGPGSRCAVATVWPQSSSPGSAPFRGVILQLLQAILRHPGGRRHLTRVSQRPLPSRCPWPSSGEDQPLLSGVPATRVRLGSVSMPVVANSGLLRGRVLRCSHPEGPGHRVRAGGGRWRYPKVVAAMRAVRIGSGVGHQNHDEVLVVR